MKMFAVQVVSGRENSYIRELGKLIEKNDLVSSFGKLIYPQQEVTRSVKGKARVYKKAAWATGYVYLEFEANNKALSAVVSAKGFLRFLSGDSVNPIPMSEEEATKVTQGSSNDWKGEKSSFFDEGQVVRITEGPFSSFTGEVIKKVSETKYTISVSVFGRPTPVDIDLSSLEKSS
jgi:transcriptional antiterminator NusG